MRPSNFRAARLALGVLLGCLPIALMGPGNAVAAGPGPGTAPIDVVAPSGCAMTHCDQSLSDQAVLSPPSSPTLQSVFHDQSVLGSSYGVGCSSNGVVVGCAFTADSAHTTTTAVYRSDGSTVWSSSFFDGSRPSGAPLVASDGSMIRADMHRIARFNPDGSQRWATPTPGGVPISLNITDNRSIVMATFGGPVSTYDPDTGAMLGQLMLGAKITYQGIQHQGLFVTTNSPAVRGNRTYIVTQFYDSSTRTLFPPGRLYAIDINRTDANHASLSVAWVFSFLGPSGASPLVIGDSIYFDGGSQTTDPTGPTVMFGVADHGTKYGLLWQQDMPAAVTAAAARDPRGGLWVFGSYQQYLYRLANATGKAFDRIDVDALIDEDGVHVPSSCMTMAGTPTQPIMLVSAATVDGTSAYVAAIDLAHHALLWKFRVDQPEVASIPEGQFPIVNGPQGPEVVFSTLANGVWGVAAALPSSPAAAGAQGANQR